MAKAIKRLVIIHQFVVARKEAGGIMKFGQKTRTAFVSIASWGILLQGTPSFAAPPKEADTAASVKLSEIKPRMAQPGRVIPAGVSPQSDVKVAAKKFTPPAAIDVALAKEGTVSGQVLGADKKGVPNVPVSIRQGKEEVAQATTDKDGRFEAKNLKGGVYLIASNSGYGLFRFWAPKSAPPAAHNQVLIMQKAVVVRAQSPNGSGEVIYDQNGQPYACVHVVDDGALVTDNSCPPVGSGGLCGLDCFTVTLLAAAIAAAVLAGIALSEIEDDEDPASP